jgi:hypothetical protein
MDDVTLQQAIQLSKDGRRLDARKLLRPFLEVDPENEKAWLWYANSFDSIDEKIKALQNCLVYCPKSKMALEGIRTLQLQAQSPELEPPEESNDFAVNLQNSQGVKFAELDNVERDTSPFSAAVEMPKENSPFLEPPTRSVIPTAHYTNPQIPNNSTVHNGQIVNNNVTSAQNAGYTESPFYAEQNNPEIKKNKLSTDQSVQVGQIGKQFRIPFFIVSILGIFLLFLLSVIIIVLFIVK